MIDLSSYIAYVAASVAIVAVPGPTVTVIVANSLRHGARAGLLNVAGTQFGLLVLIAVLAAGLSAVIGRAGAVFEIVRLLGAAYLVWLGIRLWRSDGRLVMAEGDGAPAPRPRTGFFWQGFLVILANPKALLFFGAFIPQFVDPAGNALAQTLVLGLTFMGVATLLDGAYAVATGRAGTMLTRRRVRAVERLSGSFLIGGGLWLALARRG